MTAHTLLAALPDSLQPQVRSGRELARERAEPRDDPCPTGVAPLDRLLGGGLPVGKLIEMVGRRSSGRFSLVLAALATATTAGESVALIDLGDSLDPQNAAAVGIDLERLLWLRPEHMKQALAGTEILISTGFPLVVFDLGNPPVPGGRGFESSWLRLARAAAGQGTALLITSPYRVSGTAAFIVLTTSSARAEWRGVGSSPRLLGGLATRLRLEKSRDPTLAGFREPGGGTAALRLASRAVA